MILFSLLSMVSKPHHFIRLGMEARADITWWQYLLQYWNGVSFFPPSSPSGHVYSDASGLFGCGALNPNQNSWFQLQWPAAWADAGIAAKELVPVVVAAALWGPLWAGRHICFHSDNEAVVTVIQRRHAKNHLLTDLLRCLFFYASIFNFHLSASHIPGIQNTVADAISRDNLGVLSSLLPQATQVTVPPAVAEFLLYPPRWGSPSWTEQFARSLHQASPQPPPGATSQVSIAI